MSPRFFTITLILIGSCAIPTRASAAARTYYVDATNGSDGNSGTSSAAPWKTLSKINALGCGANTGQVAPGDSVLFKKGELWREQLVMPCSGTSGSPITFGAYGTGALPRITAANSVIGTTADWTTGGANKWSRALATAPKIVIFNTNQRGIVNTAPTANYQWYWSGGRLYVYATQNPATQYAAIEAGARTAVITLAGKDYLTIDGLELYGGQVTGNNLSIGAGVFIPEESLGINIKNSTIRNNYGYGIEVQGGKDITIQNNTIKDVEGDGGSMLGDGVCIRAYASNSPSNNVTISGNTLSGYIDRQGVAFTGASDSSISRNTIMAETFPPYGLAIDIEPNVNQTASNILVEGNTIDRITGNGIDAAGNNGNISNITIRNNTLNLHDTSTGANTAGQGIRMFNVQGTNAVSGNTVLDAYLGIMVDYPSAATVSGNFIRTSGPSTGDNHVGLSISRNANVTAAYNIIYGYDYGLNVWWDTANSNPVASLYNNSIQNFNKYGVKDSSIAKNNTLMSASTALTNPSYTRSQNASDYNIFYTPNDTTNIFRYGSTYYNTLSLWQAGTSLDTHSKYQTPSYVNASGLYQTPSDFALTWNSPAIDAGTSAGYTADYFGNPIYGLPDIGAAEYQPPYWMGVDKPDKSANVRVYGDGKFRNTLAPAGIPVSLSIVPAGAKTQWLDVSVAIWNTSGNYAKQWTESSPNISGSVAHTVGDLLPNTFYDVNVGSTTIANIQTNGTRELTFSWAGGYASSRTFNVLVAADRQAPTPPANLVATPVSRTRIDLAWTGSTDNVAVTGYKIYRNAVVLAATTTTAYNDTNVSVGIAYTYQVSAIDAAGNESTMSNSVTAHPLLRQLSP